MPGKGSALAGQIDRRACRPSALSQDAGAVIIHPIRSPATEDSRMAAERITPRAQDYSQWYLDIVHRAGLAENSDVRGCMVIKPSGYAIWEKMQRALDRLFKDTGHVN